MTPQDLRRVVETIATPRVQTPQAVEFDYGDVTMACLFDEAHDRVRVLAPVADMQDLAAAQLQTVMEANFYTTLDARYATARGVLYALYVHPLRSLNDDEFCSAVEQVAALVQSFGGDYSSGKLVYGPEDELLD